MGYLNQKWFKVSRELDFLYLFNKIVHTSLDYPSLMLLVQFLNVKHKFCASSLLLLFTWSLCILFNIFREIHNNFVLKIGSFYERWLHQYPSVVYVRAQNLIWFSSKLPWVFKTIHQRWPSIKWTLVWLFLRLIMLSTRSFLS